MKFAIAEKANHLAIHSIHSTREGAERHLRIIVPIHIAARVYTDKTLTADSFEVIEYKPARRR